MLKTTDLGVYAVAGVSSAVSIIRNLVFTAPYGAKCLNQKWYTFYPDIVRPVIYVILTCLVCRFTVSYFVADTWFLLVIKGCFTVALSVIIGYFIVLGKNDRNLIKNVVKSKQIKKR